MRTRFDDVEDFISWREIANTYFQRGSSWFYHKLNGHDGNGKPDGFTPEEAEDYAQEPINESDPANVTLITCTPYGINSHRLLVIGEFFKKARVSENKDAVPSVGFSIGKETIIILIIIGIGLGIISVVMYKVRKNNNVVLNVESDDYDGYEVDDKY